MQSVSQSVSQLVSQTYNKGNCEFISLNIDI